MTTGWNSANLRRRLEQPRQKTPLDPPLHFKPNVEEKPRQERRKRDVPDRVINHAYRRYSDCGGKLYNGWRQNGRNGYLWSFSTPTVKYLLYRKSRGRQVVSEVIGDEFEGVLVSDFYVSYNVHLGFHQRCWVHLLWDINKLTEGCPDHQQLTQWAADVTGLFQLAKAYPGPDQQQYPTPRAQNRQRARDSRDFADRLLSVCQPYLAKQTPMTTLCKLVNPAVPSDNNPAERCLRHSVIAGKISGGTRSAKGSTAKMVLVSLFGTWKLQQKNPFQECLNLLTAASAGRPIIHPAVPGRAVELANLPVEFSALQWKPC